MSEITGEKTEDPISDEIDGLLRFYSGRKLISVKDIRDFSQVYQKIQERKGDVMMEQEALALTQQQTNDGDVK